MNARDNIRPKSIRLSILTALASGAITTIDDLLIAVEETRAKVTNNAQAAYHDGLIKRMRDDVTGLAAYQITAAGKKYLAKYADGSKAEPVHTQPLEPVVHVAEPVVRENRTAEPATQKIEKLAPQPSQTEIIAQKDTEIASLSRRLRDAIAEIETLNKEQFKLADQSKELREQNDALTDQLADAKASLELARMARKVEHAGYVLQRPSKPLARFAKLDRAKYRAVSSARGGKRAQVFALVAVGTAVPGAEWKE